MSKLKMVMKPVKGSTTESVIMLMDDLARLKDVFSLPTCVGKRIMAGGRHSVWSARIDAAKKKYEENYV